MGFAVRIKIAESKAGSVENAINELQAWNEARDAYTGAYHDWRLSNHLCVARPYAGQDSEMAAYIGITECQPGELLVFHHDMPWFYQVTPEMLAKAKASFEKHGVVDVWWKIVGESGEASKCLSLFRDELGLELADRAAGRE